MVTHIPLDASRADDIRELLEVVGIDDGKRGTFDLGHPVVSDVGWV